MENINYYEPSKHKVHLGIQQGKRLQRSFLAGEATRSKHRAFFRLKLYALPEQSYYVVKDFTSDEEYNLYSEIQETEDGYDFKRPVGTGKLWSDSYGKSYLKILFPLFGTQMYMSISEKERLKSEEKQEINQEFYKETA